MKDTYHPMHMHLHAGNESHSSVEGQMVEEYHGYTIEEIKERFPRVSADYFLPEKWWYEEDGTLQVETVDSMRERVKGVLRLL